MAHCYPSVARYMHIHIHHTCMHAHAHMHACIHHPGYGSLPSLCRQERRLSSMHACMHHACMHACIRPSPVARSVADPLVYPMAHLGVVYAHHAAGYVPVMHACVHMHATLLIISSSPHLLISSSPHPLPTLLAYVRAYLPASHHTVRWRRVRPKTAARPLLLPK